MTHEYENVFKVSLVITFNIQFPEPIMYIFRC